MNMLFDLSRRAIVVTGGAGHIGLTLCKALSDFGADVLCLSSRKVDLYEWDVDSVECDVSDEKQVEVAIDAFMQRTGRIDGFVNAAARSPRGINLDISRDEIVRGLETLLVHYMTCSRIALRYMTGGSIVNIASMWGLRSPDLGVYLDLKNEPSLVTPAAAGGILGLTSYLAAVAAPAVRVNALVPGWFPKKRGPERLDYLAEIKKRVPLGRIGRPDDLVGAAVFLLSDASAYVTGQRLVVDGGYTIQ